ncbi:MAG: hypothetical protein ACK6BS_03135, partial [Pseudanabaena sp.]
NLPESYIKIHKRVTKFFLIDLHDSASVHGQNMDNLDETKFNEAILRLFYDLPFIVMAITSPETMRWVDLTIASVKF